jgi:nicotinic acid mononucleotide adenylyltransferase
VAAKPCRAARFAQYSAAGSSIAAAPFADWCGSSCGSSDLHAASAGRIHVRAVTQLEISSTALRELIVAGHDPRYLLPDAVRAIIRGTGCYQPPPTR